MRQLEQFISPLLESQFPEFYRIYGPNFIQFMEAYYEWMEETGNPVNVSRNIMEWRDIDTTIDDFIIHFKNQYLLNFPVITASATPYIIKHIKDFYLSKGSPEAIKLLFLLVFGVDAEIFYPNQHIMRPSDGNWVLPQYIELEVGELAANYVGEVIYGSVSGASAYVDSFIRKRISGKFIDVLFLNHITGNFMYGEKITDTQGNLVGSPAITGSLTSINITNGGANNKIGDLFNISGQFGVDGIARVSATVDGTGKVLFTLVDGGSGYTVNSSLVYVSNTTVLFSNATNANTARSATFPLFEQIIQPLTYFPYHGLLGSNSFTVGQQVAGYLGSTLKANGYVVAFTTSNTTSGNLVISVTSGDLTLANNIQITGNTVNAQSNGGITSINATAMLIGSNSAALGVVNVGSSFYGNGAYVYGLLSNTYANITSVGTGSGASFTVGILSNTQIISVSPDFFIEFNTGNVEFISYPAYTTPNAYPSIALDGWNANVGGNHITNIIVVSGGTTYKNTDTIVFHGGNQGNTGAPAIPAVASVNTFANGAIQSCPLSNTGVNYFTMPSVTVTTSTGSGANLLANSYFALGFPANPTGSLLSSIQSSFQVNIFTIGTIASLANQNPGNNYNIAPFVMVLQPYVAGFNRRDLILNIANTNNLFSPGQLVFQSISGSVASGLVKTANSTVLGIKRISFNTFFVADNLTQITSQNANGVTQGVAVVAGITQDNTTLPMGENASITANVNKADGITSDLQILFSGYGYNPGDTLTLSSNTSEFIISGTANVDTQGIGLGYWTSTAGILNSDQMIHDNDIYQEFSYVVESSLSLDKYSDMVKHLFHPSGFRLSANVILSSTESMPLTGTPSQIELH